MFKRNNSQVSNDMSVCLLGIYTGGIWTQVGTLTQQLQVEAAMVDVIWRRDTAAAPPSPEIRPLCTSTPQDLYFFITFGR